MLMKQHVSCLKRLSCETLTSKKVMFRIGGAATKREPSGDIFVATTLGETLNFDKSGVPHWRGPKDEPSGNISEPLSHEALSLMEKCVSGWWGHKQ